MLLGLPHLEPFTGEGTESFSHWLRRFNDHAEAHDKPWTDADKLRKLKASSVEAHERTTDKLKSVYENSFSKDIAKLNLARCHHRAGESINNFVERLRKHVKAVSVGSSADCFNERFLEEFLDRVDDEIGFHVKAVMPKTMDEAMCQAMRFEGLLEARKQKQSAEDQIGQIAARVVAALNLYGHQDEPTRPMVRRTQCHNCGEWGHVRRDCYHECQGWYDTSSYDHCQASNDTYFVDDGHNKCRDSGYVNRYGLEGDQQYRNSGRYSREQ